MEEGVGVGVLVHLFSMLILLRYVQRQMLEINYVLVVKGAEVVEAPHD